MTRVGSILRYIFTTNSSFWFEKDLTKSILNYKAKIPVEIDIDSTKETIDWLKNQDEKWVVHPQEICCAIKYKHSWPSVSVNKKIIGCIKIGFLYVYIVDFNKIIKLPETMAFIYDTYVLEQHRGKGVAKYLITQAVKSIKSKGYKKVRCHIPPWNKNSINSYEKIGFKKIGYIRHFRILGMPFNIGNMSKEFLIPKTNNIDGEYSK